MLGISLAFILLILVLGGVIAYKWALRATHVEEEDPEQVRTLSGGRVAKKRGRQRPAHG